MQNKRNKSNLTKISEILPQVKQSLCLDKQLKLNAIRGIWPLVTSYEIAKESQPSHFDKSENLVIVCKNSVLSTELSMQKISILKKLKVATKNTDITFNDIRFVLK